MRGLPPRTLALGAGFLALAAVWILAATWLWQTRVPDGLSLPRLEPARYFEPALLERAADFARFLRVDRLLAIVAELVALAVLAWRAPALARGIGIGPVGSGIIVGMVMIAVVWAVGIPFDLAEQWWLRRHGLSELGYVEMLFLPWAQIGALAVTALVVIGITMLLARGVGRLWWLAGAPILAAIAVLFAFLLPFLGPYALEPIRDPSLRAAVPQLEEATGAGDTEVRVEVVSPYTNVPNAYTTGIGPSELVVLWDTLLDGRFEQAEVRFVLAHELAHAARDHIWKGLAWFALLAVPLAFAVAEVTHRRGGMGNPANVPLAALVFTVAGLMLSPAVNAVTRNYEREADWVALEATRDPAAAGELFAGFTEEALADPRPPGWAQVLFGTHPTVMDRIAMTEAWRVRNR